MGYVEDPSMVRVDFFRTDANGRPYKWYATEAVKWLTWRGNPQEGGKLIHDAFIEALHAHLRRDDGRLRYAGMLAVCLEPYHENEHPIVTVVA